MKKDKTKTAAFLLIFSVLVFSSIQALLLVNSYQLESKNFDYTSRMIISGDFYRKNPDYSRLLLLSDSLNRSAVKNKNDVLVRLKWALNDYEQFEDIIRESFKENKIDIKFHCTVTVSEYYIVNSAGEKTEIINGKNQEGAVTIFGKNIKGHSSMPDNSFYYKSPNYYLRINLFIKYDNETAYILGQMKELFLISLASSLVVFGIFIFTLKTMKNQKKLSEMKSDFINNITHEFNTPLNTIRVAGANLKNEQTVCSTGKVEQLADIIIRQNSRLQKLIEDVMKASIFEEEGTALNISDADLCELVNTAAEDIKMKYEEKRIDYKISAPKEAFCRCDEFQIMTAVYNLIDNAAKYSDNDSIIRIEIEKTDKCVELRVKDSGIGINEEDRKHIFDKFFRANNGKYTSAKGLGLGLFFVKKIIEAHSGEINVESYPGKGSIFFLKIPAAK